MFYYLKQLELGPMQNFVYLIGDPQSREAAVVDPAWNAAAILDKLKQDGYRLTHALLTHGHFDHVNAVEELIDACGVVVCIGKADLETLIWEGQGGLVIPKTSFKKVLTDTQIRVGHLAIEAIPTPGHTQGSRCYFVKGDTPAHNALFTGDTLFVGTIGRCDFPYSSPKILFETLQKIKALDGNTVFYPGHDYGAVPSKTLEKEKKTNPYLMTSSLEDFLSMTGH